MKLFHSYYAHKHIRSIKRNRYNRKFHSLIEKNSSKRILVILHLFYPDSWKEIRQYLMNLSEYNWDLVITCPKERIDLLDRKSILELNEHTAFIEFENKGFDIGPFIMALKQIPFMDYDVVFKLQSKGIHRKRIFIYKQLFFGRDWFLNLFDGVLGAKDVHLIIDKIANDPDIHIAGAKNLLVHDPAHKERLVDKTLKRYGRGSTEPGYYFVAGTCFAIKPSFLKIYSDLPVTLDDFEPVAKTRGLSYAHAIERELCFRALSSEKDYYGSRVMSVRRALKKPAEAILSCFSSERLHKLPYSIDDEFFLWKLDNRLLFYKRKQMRPRDLNYEIVLEKSKMLRLPLEKAYPYRYLNGDVEAYEKYCDYHEKNGYPVMTRDRFDELIRSIKDNGYDGRNIILIREENIIMDGQHRACTLAYLNGLDKKIEVLKIIRISPTPILKSILPRFILNAYYRRKYGYDQANPPEFE